MQIGELENRPGKTSQMCHREEGSDSWGEARVRGAAGRVFQDEEKLGVLGFWKISTNCRWELELREAVGTGENLA